MKGAAGWRIPVSGETSCFGSGKVPQGLVVGPPELMAIILHVLEQEVTFRLQVAKIHD